MDYITIPKLAEMLNVSRQTVFNWVKSNKIKASKVGGTWIIDDPDLMVRIDGKITESQKKEITNIVQEAVEQYGELFKRLSKE
jgi:excisionase family DNA binding protein